MKQKKKSPTNETTRRILNFLFNAGVFAWRHNVLPVPIPGGRYRPGSKSGVPDIIGILSSVGGDNRHAGKFFGAEIKTGRDRLRPEQEGFYTQARKLGAIIFVCKDFDDFKKQWDDLWIIKK